MFECKQFYDSCKIYPIEHVSLSLWFKRYQVLSGESPLVPNFSIWKGIWTVIRLKIDVMFEGLNHSSVDFSMDLVGFIFS